MTRPTPTYHGGPDTVFARWLRAQTSPPAADRAPRLSQECPQLRCSSIVLGNTEGELDAAMTRHRAVCRHEPREKR